MEALKAPFPAFDGTCGSRAGGSVKPLIYDGYCGAGGASMGYARAGFQVVGIDDRPQKRYPFDFIQMDMFDFFAAMKRGEYPLPDAWHCSPPCQAYTSLKFLHKAKHHADLIPETRDRLKASGKPYIIENVPGAPLLAGWKSIILCGTMFGLTTADGTAELRRHRLFELSFYPGLVPDCRHNGKTIGVYGGSGGFSKRDGVQGFSTQQRREAMGISWMTGAELSQAIPPAYTEWIGRRLRQAIRQADGMEWND